MTDMQPNQGDGSTVGSRAAALLGPIFLFPVLFCIIAAVVLWLVGAPAPEPESLLMLARLA